MARSYASVCVRKAAAFRSASDNFRQRLTVVERFSSAYFTGTSLPMPNGMCPKGLCRMGQTRL